MSAPCRNCAAPLEDTFVDLGMSPLANSFISADRRNAMEPFFPLHALVCRRCLLVQLEEFETPDHIFGDYVYFSSWSSTWLAHAEAYVAEVVERLGLDRSSRVVEVASNDGYLLRHVVARGIPCVGVDPAANVAAEAERIGVPTVVGFFGEALAGELLADGPADLLVANNVLAHVPDLHDFVTGIATVLAPTGTATIEFPHLLRLVEDCQYDTIYHEHFSYFSLLAVSDVLGRHGLQVVDVQELPTHGGSLRLWVRHDDGTEPSAAVAKVLDDERRAGLHELATYLGFAERVAADKRDLLRALVDLRDQGKVVAAYGAPAKGNTLLNHCGIRGDLVAFTVDVSTQKQGTWLPGTHIPVLHPDALAERRPDVVLVLPWNIADEVMAATAHIRDWGGQWLLRRPTAHLVP